jgi:hypothetical protein
MRKALAAAALSLAALFAGAPPAAADDTRCGAPGDGQVLGPVVVDNVIVPRGTVCVLERTQVRGNVLAKPSSELEMFGADVRGNVEVTEDARASDLASTIGGNYKCDHCDSMFVEGLTVGGSMQIVGANISPAGEGLKVAESLIGGNVEIVASSVGGGAGGGSFVIFENAIGGSLKFEKNAGGAVFNNTIAGELQIFENMRVDLLGNAVDGNLQVFKNRGPTEITGNAVDGNMQVFTNRGPTEIFRNQVRQSLQCKENKPPPFGGGNTARKKQGQCRFL